MPVGFSEMIARLSADERKVLDNVFAKHPDVKDDWVNLKEDGLRQADYSKNLDALKVKEREYTEGLEEQKKWEAWADVNVPRYNKLVDSGLIDAESGEELWTAQKADLEKQLDDAKKAAVGGEMDPAELDKRVRDIVKAAGSLTPDELKAVIQRESKTLAEETFKEQWTAKEKNFNEQTIPFVAGFSGQNAIVATHYEAETGEKWDLEKQKAFFAMMTEKKNFNPLEVEADFLKPHREKKTRDAEIEAEVEKRVKAARAALPGNGVDEEFKSDEKGALQMMLERSKDTGGDFEAAIKAQAVEAAKSLAAEGKG